MDLTPLTAMKQERSRCGGVAYAVVAVAIMIGVFQPSRASAQAAPPTACDSAASFAFDGQRVAPGVSYDAINAPVAIAECTQGVRLYPTSGRLHFELGRAFEKAGNIPRAIAAYNRAAQLAHGGGFNNLGELYRAGKGVPHNLGIARQEFEAGSALGYPEAEFNLANLLLRQAPTDANTERARQLLTSALNAGYTDASGALQRLPAPVASAPARAPATESVPAVARATGPSFDCSKIGRDALSSIICSSPQLSVQNLLLGQTYYALRHQVGAFGHDALKAEAKASNTAMKQRCAVPSTPPLPLSAQSYVACIQSETDRIRGTWMSRLTNEDLEEAKRPVEQLIAAQQELIRQGLLSNATVADGILGDGTRKALSSWQAANGLPAIGSLDDKTATLLLKLPNAPSAPLATTAPVQLPAEAAHAAPSPIDAKLAKIFTPKMLDVQVPYLETIVGPAMRLTKLQHDIELRTYLVGNCEVLAYSKHRTVSAYGLRLQPGCDADLSQFLGQRLSVTADATFGGLADALGGATGTFQSACIYDCGNATGTRVEWTWQGSHAQNFTKVQLAVALVESDSVSAAAAWQNSMFQTESHDYVGSGKFNCDGKYQDAASSAFRSVKITEIFVGQGDSADDQEVAAECLPSGGTQTVAPVSAPAPPVSNVASANTAAPGGPALASSPVAVPTPPPSVAAAPAVPTILSRDQPTGGAITFLAMWIWRILGFVGLLLPLGGMLIIAMLFSKEQRDSFKKGSEKLIVVGVGLLLVLGGGKAVTYCWDRSASDREAIAANAVAYLTYPPVSKSYEDTINEVGCPSKYTDIKKQDIWDRDYHHHWATWQGTVYEASGSSVKVKSADDTSSYDFEANFQYDRAGIDLETGDAVTVRFVLDELGNCRDYFVGSHGQLLARVAAAKLAADKAAENAKNAEAEANDASRPGCRYEIWTDDEIAVQGDITDANCVPGKVERSYNYTAQYYFNKCMKAGNTAEYCNNHPGG